MTGMSALLSTGENVKYVATKHWIVFVFPIFLVLIFLPSVIVSVWPLLFAALVLLRAIIIRTRTQLAVTNKKVFAKWGVISRHTMEQRLEKVDSIQVNQGILGRALNYGTVRINGSGVSSTSFSQISDPLAFRRSVEESVDVAQGRVNY